MSNVDYNNDDDNDDILLIPAIDFSPIGPLDDTVPSTVLDFTDYGAHEAVPSALPYPLSAGVNPASRSAQPPLGLEYSSHVTSRTTTTTTTSDPPVTLVRAYVIACLVFWFCGFVLGSFAYIQAVRAEAASYDGDEDLAKKRRRASYVLSIAGFCVGLMVLIVFVGILLHLHHINYL